MNRALRARRGGGRGADEHPRHRGRSERVRLRASAHSRVRQRSLGRRDRWISPSGAWYSNRMTNPAAAPAPAGSPLAAEPVWETDWSRFLRTLVLWTLLPSVVLAPAMQYAFSPQLD